MTNLANKLVNPFAIIRKKIEPTTTVDSQIDLRINMKRQVSLVDVEDDIVITPRRTVTISPMKRAREDDDEPIERRKVQILNVNSEIRRPPSGLFAYEEESKRNGKKLKSNCTALYEYTDQ